MKLQVLAEDREPDRIRFPDSPTDILFWLSLKNANTDEISSRKTSETGKSVRSLKSKAIQYSTFLANSNGEVEVPVSLIFQMRDTCVFGSAHSLIPEDTEIELTFKPEKEPDSVRTYPPETNSLGSILVFWGYGRRSFITCFGDGRSSCVFKPQIREHTARYVSSHWDFSLADYHFEYRLPPIVYNTIQVRSGCILDTMPSNYAHKIHTLKSLGVRYVVIHDHWFRDFGDWRPDYPKEMHDLIGFTHKSGLEVLLYWNPGYNMPHDERLDAKTFISGWGREKAPSTIRILDPKYDEGRKLMRQSLSGLLSRYTRIDGVYIDLFWMWPSRDMTRYSFLDWQRAAEECVKIIRNWKNDATILFDATFASPPAFFHAATPLFVNDPRLGMLFGGANTWMGIVTDPKFRRVKPDMRRILEIRNECMVYGSPPYILDAMLDYPESYSYVRFLRGMPRQSLFSSSSAGIVRCSQGIESSIYTWDNHARIFLANMENREKAGHVSIALDRFGLKSANGKFEYSVLTCKEKEKGKIDLELSTTLHFEPYGYHVLDVTPEAETKRQESIDSTHA